MKGRNEINMSDIVFSDSYVCSECCISGVKLWRGYCHADTLLCALCAAAADKEGRFSGVFPWDGDTIGWYVPAVPYPDEDSNFYGYTSVPNEGVIAWYSLRTYANDSMELASLHRQLLRVLHQKLDSQDFSLDLLNKNYSIRNDYNDLIKQLENLVNLNKSKY